MENTIPNIPVESVSAIVQAVDPNEPPPKRKPGRPKGSGKKQPPDPTIISEKIKRPVGRPRKDGLPAGSVGARKANQQRRSSVKLSADAPQLPPGVPFPGAYYPQHPGIPPPWQGFTPQAPQSTPPITNGNAVPNAQHPSIDPNLNRDEWAELSCTKPNILMQSLLGAIAAPNPIASGGPTVEEAFRSHLASLMPSQNQNKDAHSIPSLYSVLRTLWLPSSPSYLSLIAPRTTARVTHSEHRFLYWDPLPLVLAGIHCTACGSTLQNRGRIRSGPVKVYDLDKPFFIIGCEYACKSASCVASTTPEGRKFASTDASVMQGLPVRLRELAYTMFNMPMPTAADITRMTYKDAEKLRREQRPGGDPSKVDYSIMPTCYNCDLPIMGGKPLICSGCRSAVFCSMNCHKANWKAGRYRSPGHKLLCPKNKIHMEKVPQVQALLKQFPWGRIEKDGTFAEPLVRALHNVLGAEGFGYWSIPGGSNPHLKHASDPPRPAGAPRIDDVKGFEHGYMLLSNQVLTDETGWKLEKRLIPRLVFDIGTEPELASKADIVDWDSWYKWRNLPKESPAALLLHYPLTVYQLLVNVLHVTGPKRNSATSRQALHVHYIGAEVELNMLPLFSELALLLPYTDIKMTLFGVAVHSLVKKAKKNSIAMKAKQNQPVYTYTSPASCGASTLSIFLYGDHENWDPQHPFIRYIHNKPDAVVGLNAGLINYPAWQSIILYCHMYNESFAVTEYAEQSAEQQRDSFPLIIDHILPQARLNYHGSEIHNLTQPREYPIAFNPFQCPGQRGIGQSRLPNVPNGFTIRVVGNDQQDMVNSISAGVSTPASDLSELLQKSAQLSM